MDEPPIEATFEVVPLHIFACKSLQKLIGRKAHWMVGSANVHINRPLARARGVRNVLGFMAISINFKSN